MRRLAMAQEKPESGGSGLKSHIRPFKGPYRSHTARRNISIFTAACSWRHIGLLSLFLWLQFKLWLRFWYVCVCTLQGRYHEGFSGVFWCWCCYLYKYFARCRLLRHLLRSYQHRLLLVWYLGIDGTTQPTSGLVYSCWIPLGILVCMIHGI